ncbi:MAG: pirin family protein [Acidimicrobiales bacterium]|nr:pirin family protein [Acidimicrobiales bacterium]
MSAVADPVPVPDPDVVVQVVALSTPWPTLDPFLFCVHHDDAYPPGNGRHGPEASLAGRSLGADFSGRDGWSMYHGSDVPGFPRHPHRGFETITFVRRGLVDHADSLGAAARYGRGDVQWMTAGAGVVHAEMFPLLDEQGPNPLELFQIWLNLPAADKMVPPSYTMLWDEQLPRRVVSDAGGRAVRITVVAGALELGEPVEGSPTEPAPPPPDSWAVRPGNELAIWHLELDAGAEVVLPPALGGAEIGRVCYVFEGDAVQIGTTEVANGHGAVVRADVAAAVRAGRRPAELLVLQGRPLREPVAQYGPFVMNDRAGIEQAFADYQRSGFGGWPWPQDGPVHGGDPARFARHADGRVEAPPGGRAAAPISSPATGSR